jgi:drug/metabolite transporter (DMT)-like permease
LNRPRTGNVDALLLLMVVIWGSNYSIVKFAFRELPPFVFNGLRMVVASAVFLALIAAAGAIRVSRRELAALAGLALVGHFAYQICFIGGLARTSVANSSLIVGCSPVTVVLLSALAGHERVRRWQWAGIALSVAGVYLVVGRGASMSEGSLAGDLLTVGAIVSWGVYTVAARPLLARHSALVVTGYSMAIGTLLYLPLALPGMARLAWREVNASTWIATVLSGLLALSVAYWIWYIAVQRIGNARTAVYSNMIPVVAMIVAVAWLGEPVHLTKALGALAILGGVALTRIGYSRAVAAPPPEE